MELDRQQLDKIYTGYNYEIKSRNHKKVRVYARKFGIYNAAEIIPLTDKYKPDKLQLEYSSLGYATKVRHYSNIDDVENQLFKEYFLDSPFYQVNKNKYESFTKKQIAHLPDSSKYSFIGIPYDFLIYENGGSLISEGSSTSLGYMNIVKHLMEILGEQNKPVFVIIEAAAGFGKTCTAFEILRNYIEEFKNLLPFFTELSKNREARVFKHILLNEINNHFPEGIKSDIVINGIKKGRIPLIIDGFDELLSKDLSQTSSSFVQAGNMLSTIMELLRQNAKIIITSRKTAIFDSESFNNWASENDTNFIIARINLKEPTIENWLSKDKIKLFEKNDYDIEKLSHPVLLSYLRNIDNERILELIQSDENSLFDHYFNFLLNREKVRQNLLIETDDQFRIFRGLTKFMLELDFKADNKEGIKDYFREYFKDDIIKCISRYPISERPTFEDIVETLSNHVFLDRKEGGLIGFINDFIFGALIGQGLIKGDYKLDNKNCEKLVGIENFKLAVQAYRMNSINQGKILWAILNNCEFQFDQKTYFEIDYIFTGRINRDYRNLQLDNLTFKEISFKSYVFSEILFINCTFTKCVFDSSLISESVFQKCIFYSCITIDNKHWDKSIILEECKSDNGIERLLMPIEDSGVDKSDTELDLNPISLLILFFNSGTGAPKNRSLRQISDHFDNYSDKQIRKMLKDFTLNGFLHKQGDIYFISKKGIDYYNSLK